MPTTDTVQLIDCKPGTKKTGDSRNACVCSYRSVKLLTDDHSDFAGCPVKGGAP